MTPSFPDRYLIRRTSAAVVTLAFVLSSLGRASGTPAVIVVTTTKGKLSVKPETGQEHEVTTAQRTLVGDTLETSAASLADIALADAARMRLGPLTKARVLRTDGSLTLDLAQGGVCIVATSGQVGVTSGVTLTTATAPAIYSVARDSAGATVLAVYKGQVRTGGVTAEAGQAYSFTPAGGETAVPLSSLSEGLAPLECPDPAIVADAVAREAPIPKPAAGASGGGGGGGGGGVLGIIGGLGLIAAAAGGGGGKGGGVPGAPAPAGTSTPSPVAPPVGASTAPPSTGTLTLGPSAAQTIGTSGSPNAFTISASEPGFSGTFSASSSPPGIVNIAAPSPASGAATVSFTVTAASPGTTQITVSDGAGHSASLPTTTVTGALSAPRSLTIPATASSGTVAVSEPYYSGPVSSTLAGCANVVTAPASAPASGGANSSAAFTFTAIKAGTCTATFTDGRQTTSQTAIAVVAGPFTATASTAVINYGGSGTSATITATESHGGTFSAVSSNPNVASVSGPTGSGSPVTFTVAPGPQAASGGTAQVTVSDGIGHHATALTFTVTGALTAAAQVIAASGTLTATEPFYAGAIAYVPDSSCSTRIAFTTASPQNAIGGAATFAFNAIGLGSCTVTLSDQHGQAVAATVTISTLAGSAGRRAQRYAPIGSLAGVVQPVSAGALAASDTSVLLRIAPGANGLHTVSIVEAGYAGAFTLVNSHPDVAAATLAAEGAGRARLTLAAVSAGMALVTVADANGNHLTIPVTVTSTRVIDPYVRRPGTN